MRLPPLAQPCADEDFLRNCVTCDEVGGGLLIRLMAGGRVRTERAQSALLPGGEVYAQARRLGSRDVARVDVRGLSLTGRPIRSLCRWLARRPCPQQAFLLGGSLFGHGVARGPIECKMQRLPALVQHHILSYACPLLDLQLTGCSLTDEDVSAIRSLTWCRLTLQYNSISSAGALELLRSAAASFVPDVGQCYVLDLRGNPVQGRPGLQQEARRCLGKAVEFTGSLCRRCLGEEVPGQCTAVVVALSPGWIMDISDWERHMEHPAKALAAELVRGEPTFWQCPCCRGKRMDMRATHNGAGFVEMLRDHLVGRAHWRNVRRIAFSDEEWLCAFGIDDRAYYFNVLSGAQGWTREEAMRGLGLEDPPENRAGSSEQTLEASV